MCPRNNDTEVVVVIHQWDFLLCFIGFLTRGVEVQWVDPLAVV